MLRRYPGAFRTWAGTFGSQLDHVAQFSAFRPAASETWGLLVDLSLGFYMMSVVLRRYLRAF